MTLRELRYFIEVYQHSSIVKAAEKLFVVPSAVSNAIKKLETEFNVILFSRSANHLTPTTKGDTFYKYALAVMVEVSKLEYKMKYSVDGIKRKSICKIAISQAILSVCGDEIYDELNKNFPDHEFVLTTYLLLNEPDFYMQYDIIIVLSYHEELFQTLKHSLNKELSVDCLRSFPIYAWLDASSPLCAYPSISYEMLKNHQLIIYDNFMRYNDIMSMPINKNKVFSIKIEKQLIDYLEKGNSFIIDMPLLHGELQYRDLFKDHHIALKKLEDVGSIRLI